ncbi:MAG: hypothetical protein ACLGG8_05925 [Gammaproteobacteria bacterium]
MKDFRPAFWLLAALVLGHGAAAHAQGKIYRCGNEYTNDPKLAKEKGCKLMEGGNITIIQGTTPRASSEGSTGRGSAAAPRPATPASAEQRARDSDARAILETELRRAQERLSEARKAYADGNPEKQGIEGRNHQRYLDRVAELKAAVDRAEADVVGIERELSRLPGGAPASAQGAR